MTDITGEKRLRCAVFYFQRNWQEALGSLPDRLEEAGIACVRINSSRLHRTEERLEMAEIVHARVASVEKIWDAAGCGILFTDDAALSAEAGRKGMACVMCADLDGGFFEGAQLVTDSPAELETEMLEKLFLHVHGWPVTIAVSERLIIREITEADFGELYRISVQKGMEFALRDEDNCFLGERLSTYIVNVYRLYGYGLWCVLDKTGRVLGSCGLSDFNPAKLPDAPSGRFEKNGLYRLNDGLGGLSETVSRTEMQGRADDTERLHRPDGSVEMRRLSPEQMQKACWLELQYMLDQEQWGKGLGLEMCREVLCYAFARTDAKFICIRTHKANVRSIRLARRLGFRFWGENFQEIRFYVKDLSDADFLNDTLKKRNCSAQAEAFAAETVRT